MTNVYPADTPADCDMIPLIGAGLIACNHCGIVAMDTPAFGWRRYRDDDGALAHHCPAGIALNEYMAQGLVHMKAPDEAVEYEDIDLWVAELVGARDD